MKILNRFTTTLLLLSGATSACATAIDIGEGWMLSGDERAGHLTYNYGNPDGDIDISRGHKDSQGFYVIPKISLETPSFNGLKFKVTGAGATDFGMNDPEKESRLFVFGAEKKPFTILQEAFAQYDSKTHHFVIGRNEIVTPMIESDDYYMLANSFEVARYDYKGIEDIIITGGYFHKMAGVWDSGADGANFHTMADTSFVDSRDKENVSDGGVGFGAIDYKKDEHHLQVWNYYATDLYNTLFAQYDYTKKLDLMSYNFGLQFINFSEIGELAKNDFTNINYSMYSARFDGNIEGGFGFATGITKYSDGEGQGATLGAWGGYPYFANGLIFHFFEAGSLRNAASYKVQASYDFDDLGIKNLHFRGRYTYFSLDDTYSFTYGGGEAQNFMAMYGGQLKYQFLNGGYFTGTYETHKVENEPITYALRLIGGYKF
ncbi:MAG: hypothetical protein U9N52_01870 [Campylobacterota bacterium]|nr:hypothetical protein [Campylobacterota bacterium]